MPDPTAPGSSAEEESYPRHLRRELRHLDRRAKEGDPLWPAQLAVAIAIALQLALSDKLVVGSKWLIPGVEGLLLLTLVVVAPARASHPRWRHQRGLLWAILGLVTLTYLVSLGLLVHYLVSGGRVVGHTLIGSGVVLWVTNVLLFSSSIGASTEEAHWIALSRTDPGPISYSRRWTAPEFHPDGQEVAAELP